jgi:glycosyltransferase involved in cell wall biosynthesis
MSAMFKEPGVSVAIVNWNYQSYVAEAIQSVKRQNYQNFRCLVLDNGSDDQSVDVITAAIDGHPQFSFHRSDRNLGHLGGALHLLKYLEDDFVTFLDADDVLAPDYLATHLQVHLAARAGVGFTSSNCPDINAAGFVLSGGNWWMSESWRKCEPSLRPIDSAVRLAAVDDAAYERIATATRYLTPETPRWRWCVGSSNMFRRALLERVRPHLESTVLFGGVDGFFTPILHAISGTQLIDLPLSAYRVHGANDCSEMPHIRNVHGRGARVQAQCYDILVLSVASWVENIESLLGTISPGIYWQGLDVVASIYPDFPVFEHPRLKSAFITNFAFLVNTFGARVVIRELRRRMPFKDCAEIVRAARKDMMPKLVVQELRRTLRLLRGRPPR